MPTRTQRGFGYRRRRMRRRRYGYKKKRTYRKKTFRRFKRRVRSIASNKLRDNMVHLVVNEDDTTGAPGVPKTMLGGALTAFAFCPSARSAKWTEGESEYSRQKTNTFAKGYLDKVTLQTNSGGNWRWRRIVFQGHCGGIPLAFGDTAGGASNGRLARATGGEGYVRTAYDFSANTPAYQELFRYLFQGTQSIDWFDIFNATINKRRVRLISDKIRNIQSGNGGPHWGGARDYFPINRQIVYRQKESGNEKTGNTVSEFDSNSTWFSQDEAGGGDVYVVDLFACASGVDSDTMDFLSHGTYYWHE